MRRKSKFRSLESPIKEQMTQKNHSMTKLAGFNFSKITIIESLEDHELKTGEKLSDYLTGLCSTHGYPITIEYIKCRHAIEFKEIIAKLVSECLHGQVPILHVECHGDKDAGLEFENGSCLEWRVVYDLLVQLNVASGHNIFAAFSACFGAYFMRQVHIARVAPCYALLAPGDSAYPDELLAGFSRFYAELLLTNDAGLAVMATKKQRLSSGKWIAETSEIWYEKVAVHYVKTSCTTAAMKPRLRLMYRTLLKEGNRMSPGRIKREMAKQHRIGLVEGYFDQYFHVHNEPKNRARFASIREHVNRTLEPIWNSKEYRV